jgi:Rubrerythrin
MQDQARGGSSTTVAESPVDDATYNVLQALTSKLEAIEAYGKYSQDGGQGAQLFQQMAQQERQHAEQLLDALKERLR